MTPLQDLRAGAPRSPLRWLARSLLRRLAGLFGYRIVRDTFYSPLPEVSPADDPVWRQSASLVGLELNLEAQFDLLEGDLAPPLMEFEQLLAEAPPDWPFDPANGYFQGADAAILYAMLRRLRPRRVLEIGSGSSTVIAATAVEKNEQLGASCDLRSVDPAPRLERIDRLPGLSELRRQSASEIPLSDFCCLAENDILLIDSSHTVKRGSEVNYLVLEILPRLAPGVRVHVHDIFLPRDYPQEWFERGTFLSEQYLVHAFLVDNPGWSIELALQALSLHDEERFSRAVRLPENHPFGRASLWIRRNA